MSGCLQAFSREMCSDSTGLITGKPAPQMLMCEPNKMWELACLR